MSRTIRVRAHLLGGAAAGLAVAVLMGVATPATAAPSPSPASPAPASPAPSSPAPATPTPTTPTGAATPRSAAGDRDEVHRYTVTTATDGVRLALTLHGEGDAVDPVGCTDIPLSGFGAAATRSVAGEVEPRDGLTCHTVTAAAGLHFVEFAGDDQYVHWTVVDGAGVEICSPGGVGRQLCTIPTAGRYSLYTSSRDDLGDRTHPYTVSVHPLATTDGCADPVGTGWDSPPARGTAEKPLQVDCLRLDAAPGQRILLEDDGIGRSWITDASGDDICEAARDGEQDGCLLTGAGPYRIIAVPALQRDEPRPYTLSARSLSQPQGCESVTPGRFGAPAAGPATTNRCRLLTVPAAESYAVEAVDADDDRVAGTVYDSTGTKVCSAGGYCTFPAPGTFTMIVNSARPSATVLLPRTGTVGCTATSDDPIAAPRTVRFDTPGQYQCLVLPTDTGAGLTLLQPQDTPGPPPAMTVVDVDGAYQCGNDGLIEASCTLEGKAPFRVLLNRDDSDAPRTYSAVFATPRGAGCPILPRAAFGAAPGATRTLVGSTFAGCWTIPAGQPTATDMFGFRRTAGTGVARLSLFDEQGHRRCDRRTTDAGSVLCTLGAGSTTVIVTGSTAAGTFQLFRHNVGAAAPGCRTITSTLVGGPAISGTSAPRGDLQCHRVTANALDRFLVDTRDARGSTRVMVTDQNGREMGCAGWVAACPVKAAGTTYQVLISDTAAAGTTPYRLDVWKTSVAGKVPAECSVIPNNAYGFGPYSGTLSDTRAGLCLATTVRGWNDYDVQVRDPARPGNATDFDFDLWSIGRDGARLCAQSRDFSCRVTGDRQVEPVLFVLSPGERIGSLPYRLEATCGTPFCGVNTFGATAVTPGTLVSGARRTFTVRGSTLHLKDTVGVTVAGRPTLTATVRAVSADRSTLTAEVDLTAAPAGRATVTVRSFRAGVEPVRLGNAFTITLPAPRAIRAPSVTGTRAVGGTVRAAAGTWTPPPASYAYQWLANGAPITGATGVSYLVPASLLGKKLSVRVTARRTGHPNGVATSAAATVARGKAPRATVAPKVTGTAAVGRTVRSSVGAWSPKASAYRYEWRLNGVLVHGATGTSLRLTAAMRAKRLTVTVIATRPGHGDGRATSAPVTIRR